MKPPNLTHRDLRSLEETASLSKTQAEKTLQNKQIAADVTDRLYNPKQVSKLRNKTAHGDKKEGKGKQAKFKVKSLNHKHDEEQRLSSPKNASHAHFTGSEYLHGNRFAATH